MTRYFLSFKLFIYKLENNTESLSNKPYTFYTLNLFIYKLKK